jgi:LPPG:FO 2-phospho-L-lactate transferase
MAIERCVILAGGTGGAKLAAGMEELLGDGLSVIANTADDIEVLGVDVSPDPDLITYWLSGEIDEERGWGLRDDTFTTFERLVQLGAPDWFRLSDRDLATCLYRRSFIADGGRRTDAQAQIARALGVSARVLPMCEQRVRTRVRTPDGWRDIQQFLIADRAEPPVEAVELEGIGEARPTPEVSEAISSAEAIVIGPSNPVISIGPILAIAALREAIAGAAAPVVAVSPYVAGEVVKGPTDAFMRAIGRPSTAAGVASLYEGLIEGIVCDQDDPDEPPAGLEVLACPTLMEGAPGRRRLAERTLELAERIAPDDCPV